MGRKRVVLGLGVTTPNVKNRTLRGLDHSFEAAKDRIVPWNTVYLERAVAALRGNGIAVDDESLAHLSPLVSRNCGRGGRLGG
jgi:hypothetical protein